jgi:hypothetical protein
VQAQQLHHCLFQKLKISRNFISLLASIAGFKFFLKVNICLEGKTAGLHPK